MSYPHPHPDPHVVDWADWMPADGEDLPAHLQEIWLAAYWHIWTIDALWEGEWPEFRELTTGCICREAADWYPGQPPNPACLFHHRCNVAQLSRSRHQEGMGWRCPRCGAGWTLTRALEPVPPARLYPTMAWIRDASEGC